MRVDFAIHDDGVVVSRYLNLGTGQEPNAQLGPRSDYYKLWSEAMGRKPEKNEPMDPAKIVGVEFLVTVEDKQLGGNGETYSVVKSVRREPVAHEALTSLLNNSSLNSSSLSSQVLSSQTLFSSTAQVQVESSLVEDSQENHPPTLSELAQLKQARADAGGVATPNESEAAGSSVTPERRPGDRDKAPSPVLQPPSPRKRNTSAYERLEP
jgi:hypothetical protein